MTTALKLIQAAFREGNLIAVGSSPTASEQTEALDKLNRLVNGVFGYEMGENLADWLFPAPQRTGQVATSYPQLPSPDYVGPFFNAYLTPYPPTNSRVVWGMTTGTLYFSDKPEPGSRMSVVQGSGAGDAGAPGNLLTLNGNGRYIQDPADMAFKTTVVLTAPITGNQWFYRDDLGQWVLCQDLVIGAENPFPKEFDDFFVCALSKRLAPSYNKITAAETVETAKNKLTALKSRYRQSQPTVYGSENFPRTAQSFLVGDWWL